MQKGDGMLTSGSLLLDRYRIERVLGQGGMGSVFLATHVLLDRQVAIKQLYRPDNGPLDRSILKLFKHEAVLLQNLKHPRLPAVYDYLEIEGCPYLVMEYVPGRNLATIVASGARQTEIQTYRWALALCEVLEYLHSRTPPVIFRDIKPQNVMLDVHGQIRLIDFGIAKVMENTGETHTLAKRSGSPGYSAPEQYHGFTDVRSDIYSLGATLYCILSNERPPASVEIAAGVAKLVPLHELRPDITRQFCDAIHWAMELKAADRPESVRDFRRSLEAAFEKFSMQAQPPPAGIGFANPDLKNPSREMTNPLTDLSASTDLVAGTGSSTNPLGPPPLRAISSGPLGSTSVSLSQLPPPPPPAPEPPETAPQNQALWQIVVGALAALAVVTVVAWGLLWRTPSTAPSVLPPPKPLTHTPILTDTPQSPQSQGLYENIRVSDDATAFVYDGARNRLTRVKDYRLNCTADLHGKPVQYRVEVIRNKRVRLDILSGAGKGETYTYPLDQKGAQVTVQHGGKTATMSPDDKRLAGLPITQSIYDRLFEEVQDTKVEKQGQVVINGHPCWILQFSNGIKWDVDPDMQLILRAKDSTGSMSFDHIEINAHGNAPKS